MPSLFAAVPALDPCPSAPHLVLSSSRRLSSLARQRPPLPAVSVAAAATDGEGGGERARQMLSLGRYLDQQHRRRVGPEFVADRAMVS